MEYPEFPYAARDDTPKRMQAPLRYAFSFSSRIFLLSEPQSRKGYKKRGPYALSGIRPSLCIFLSAQWKRDKTGFIGSSGLPVTAPLGRADASFAASVLVDGAGGSARLGKRCSENAGYAAKRPAIEQKRMTPDCVVALRQSRVMDGTWALPSVITSIFY